MPILWRKPPGPREANRLALGLAEALIDELGEDLAVEVLARLPAAVRELALRRIEGAARRELVKTG